MFTPNILKTDLTFELRRFHRTSLGRKEVEQFIANRFHEEYQANIIDFMPLLLAVYDSESKIISATGMRPGVEESFFLENYLDHPVEKELLNFKKRHGKKLDREFIVEIGNLASESIVGTRFLFKQLLLICVSENYQWIVFTGCNRLCKLFKLINVNLIELGKADEKKLKITRGQWGSYYQYPRSVMAGYLSEPVSVYPVNFAQNTNGVHYG